ncbi:hypothetical protein [Nocardia mexicana]|uniref:hypothetical protein n=1 Tax=Nocardia mexicana TaxID=279262 RepID=UPI0008334354|nr:hypothetical protein [Nocardia mexicana]
MRVRRLLALTLFALVTSFGVAACSAEGQGAKSDCNVSGCTITFDRGVNAKASFLGVDAELVAVNGNTVTLKVAGQQVDVPVGETQPADGINLTVQEVTQDKVVVKAATGVGAPNPS